MPVREALLATRDVSFPGPQYLPEVEPPRFYWIDRVREDIQRRILLRTSLRPCHVVPPSYTRYEVSRDLSREPAVFIGRKPHTAARRGPTVVAVLAVTPGGRSELERLVQGVDRKHPEWTARSIEAELEALAPVGYGYWKDNTPSLAARLRQVQRWRRGSSGPPARRSGPRLFPHLWPMGERQRQKIEPAFEARSTAMEASHRVFLYNCSTETIRDVRVVLGGREVCYDPAIAAGRFVEVYWQKNNAIRTAALAAADTDRIPFRLLVEFAIARGTKQARLDGQLTLDASNGWISFTSPDGQERELR